MNHNELLESWLKEEIQPFKGWDFSYLSKRVIEEQPHWNYAQRVAELMDSTNSVVDLGTGGGERLLDLRPHWCKRTVAIEDYPPNVRLSHERLEPLGVPVIEAVSNELVALPFASGTFDLVINRNTAFHPSDVARVLSSGGTFLTNQVHGLTLLDLLTAFGATPQWAEATPEKYIPLLETAGMAIVDVQNWRGKTRFSDVGALVYYLKAIPWLVPDFNVKAYKDVLFKLQEQLEVNGELAFESRLYLIEARKF
jgi:SAM-dependent methyltransferase